MDVTVYSNMWNVNTLNKQYNFLPTQDYESFFIQNIQNVLFMKYTVYNIHYTVHSMM